MVHPKIYIIDNKCAIVGSANLSKNSFYNYVEFIQFFKDKEQIKIIKEDFEKLSRLNVNIDMDAHEIIQAARELECG